MPERVTGLNICTPCLRMGQLCRSGESAAHPRRQPGELLAVRPDCILVGCEGEIESKPPCSSTSARAMPPANPAASGWRRQIPCALSNALLRRARMGSAVLQSPQLGGQLRRRAVSARPAPCSGTSDRSPPRSCRNMWVKDPGLAPARDAGCTRSICPGSRRLHGIMAAAKASRTRSR